MNGGSLVATVIWLPVLAAICCYVFRGHIARHLTVAITSAILIVGSILFLVSGEFTYTPGPLFGVDWGTIISVLDFAILLYFLYVGIVTRSLIIVILSLLQIAPLAYFEFAMASHIEVDPAFVVDRLAIVMSLIICIIGSLICVYGLGYMRSHEEHLHLERTRQPRFFFYMVLFLGAMNGLVFANNLLWLAFFWEVTTLCCYQLILHDLTPIAKTNALRALWMNLIGGVGFAVAIIAAYQSAHTLAISELLEGTGTPVVLLAFAMLALAAFTKSAQVPFQGWLLGAMVAPTPVSALLHSSTMVKAGVYLVVRMAPAFQGTLLTSVISLVGGFAFLVTAILAISQSNAKKVLAYSTIGNLGLIILAAGINTPLAMTAAISLIVFHAVSKGLLFLCAGTIEQNIGSRDIEDMSGLVRNMPFTTTVAIVGILSMVVPPFGMLLSKWAVIEATASWPYGIGLLFILLLVFGSASTVVFWAKWAGRLLGQLPSAEELKPEGLPSSMTIPFGILVAGAVVLSVLAGPFIASFILPAVSKSYASQVGLSYAGLLTDVGFFPVTALTAVAIIAVIVPLLSVRVSAPELRAVYMCGENSPFEPDRFLTTADARTPVSVGSLYLSRAIGEGALNKWVVPVGVVLLLVMVGVVI